MAAVFLAADFRARDAALDLVPLRAGALVVLRTLPFFAVLRVALVALRPAVRPAALVLLATVFDVFDADEVAFFTRRLAVRLALPVVLATRFSAAVAAFLIAAIESPTASWRPSPS